MWSCRETQKESSRQSPFSCRFRRRFCQCHVSKYGPGIQRRKNGKISYLFHPKFVKHKIRRQWRNPKTSHRGTRFANHFRIVGGLPLFLSTRIFWKQFHSSKLTLHFQFPFQELSFTKNTKSRSNTYLFMLCCVVTSLSDRKPIGWHYGRNFLKPLSFKIIIGYHGFNANYNSETVFLKPRGRNPPLPLDRITSIHHIPFIFRILQGTFC